MNGKILLLTAALALYMPTLVDALASEAAQLTRGRLFERLSSPSGKLTISPEIVIPEPSDPTAILLQADAVQTLSERIRTAKANSAWVSGGITSIQAFCSEQEKARGNFPGPLPVIYCGNEVPDLQSIAEAGAGGVVVQVCGGNEIESVEQITSDETLIKFCQSAVACGIQPIPEVTVSDVTAERWGEVEVEKLVDAICSALGNHPVSVLLTMNPKTEEQKQVSLPKVPKSLGKKIPILGSVRVTAGKNRLGTETQRFRDAGFTGVILRSDCVPGFRLNPDLDIVGRFWSACIGDLKSTRSKTFEFNSRNNMEKSSVTQWAKYQNSVIESGALGDPEDSYSIVDEAAGEYKGFA